MNERQRILAKTLPFLLVGLLVFVLYLVLFVDIAEMMNKIQNTNLLVYSLAAISLVGATFFFALTWQYLLFPLSVKVPFRKTFAYVWIGVFADLLIPAEAVSGEIAKIYLMSKEPTANTGKVLASLLSQRIFGTVTTAATLFICFFGLVFLGYSLPSLLLQILVAIAIMSALAIAFLVVVTIKEQWTYRLVTAFMRFVERISKGRFKLERFQSRIVDSLKAFYRSLRTLSSQPTKLAPAALFNILSWLSSIAIMFLVFVSTGYLEPNVPVFFLKVSIVYTLLIAIKSIPVGVPAEVGLPEIVMTTLFILFGIPTDVSAAVTVLTRILTVWLSLLIGFVAVQWFGVRSLMESGIFGETKDKV